MIRWEGEVASGGEQSGASMGAVAAKKPGQRGIRRWAAMWWDVLSFNVMATFFTFLYVYKQGWPSRQVKKELGQSSNR